jgi:predicted NACHT family NTPase
VVDGGSGNNTFVVTGFSTNFKIDRTSATSATVTDKTTGAVDTLTNIERIRYADPVCFTTGTRIAIVRDGIPCELPIEDLRLTDVYIDLDTTELRHVEREEDLRRYLREVQPKAERVPIQEMVNRYAKLLIMGDPGSGKSTLVKHLAYLLAQAGLAEDPTPWLERLGDWQHGLLLPVRVELRRLAAWAGQRASDEADLLLEYLRHTWEKQGLSGFWETFLESLNAGTTTALFLLDGLDEVPTAQRQMVVDTVNGLADMYPEQRYVVTCRPYAYIGQPWRLNGFHEVTLAPFDKEQITRFVTNWYTQLARRGRIREDEADEKARSLQRAVTRRDLRGLAERPLLLTVMAQLHAYRGKLPDDRTQLYADAVDLLLERWESRVDEEGILERLAIPGLKMSDLKSGLYEVAYRAHSLVTADNEDAADIPQASLREWLAPYLGGDWNKAGEFVDYIRERAGLLIRHKTEAYTFPHRSFQEFLAAAHWLSWKDYPSKAADKVREDWDRWREVFVLSAGYAARTERLGLALAAVNALLPEDFM